MADQDDDQKKLAMAPPDAAPKTALPVATIAPPGAPLPATPPQMAANASAPQLPGIAPPTALPAPAMPNPMAPPGMPQNNRIPSLPPPQIQSGGARLWDKASGVQGAPGVLAKIGAGIARAADVVGEGISPRIAALVPGSETNTRLQNKENEAQFERREQLDTQREGVEQKPEEAELAGEMRGKLQADRDSDAATRQQAALKQQADLAAQREKGAEASRTQTIGAAQARQDALFAQQNELEGKRESAAEKARQETESAQEGRLEKTLAAKGDSSPFMRTLAENAAKDVATANGADFRWRSMNEAYPKALKGDQQAMVSLLTNHIGMTLGMQKGARITKDILNEAQKSTPWLQGVKAKFDSDGYLSGITLTPQQMEQMIGLAKDQRANAWQQVSDSARQAGVDKEASGMIPKDLRSGGGGAGGIKIIRDANGRITEIQ